MGNSHATTANSQMRPKMPDVCQPTSVKLVSRSGPNDDEVIVSHLGPVLATSRSFDCNTDGDEREACRQEALRAAKTQCSLLGGNCVLEAKVDVTPALDDGPGAQAKDCYIVSGNACILRNKADMVKAAAKANARNDGRIREGTTLKLQPPPPRERHSGPRKADHRIRDGPPSKDRGGALLTAPDGLDVVNWLLD